MSTSETHDAPGADDATIDAPSTGAFTVEAATTEADASTAAASEPFRGSTFRSLKSRNFRLFFSGQTISQIGNWLTLIAQSLLVLKLTDSGIALGLLAACQFGPVLILGAWSGLVADRTDKRKLLIVVQIFAMMQSFALAFIAFMHHPSVAAIYVIAVFGGIATAFDNPARRAFVVEMVPESDVQNAVSLNSALMTGSRVFGPALAGLLIATTGYGWTFMVDALSYIAVIVGLIMMRTKENRRPVVTPKGKGQIRAGLRYARTQPELWVPLVMMAIVGTLTFNFQTVMPLLVKRTLHGTTTTFTLIYSVVSIGSLVGALLSARRTSISVNNIIVASLGFGGAMILLALTPNVAFAYVIGLAVGFSSITFMTASTAIMQLRADPNMRGRVLALQAIVFLGSTPIGGPIIGWVCQQFGARWGVMIGGVAAVVAAGYGWRAVRNGQTVGTPTPAPMVAAH
ncbi:MAG: arabinose efflux permease family protein [Ilumatobacteraceae bacterium]|nr:arabinose efflux permease family protein [Ilumatobacteraceae bacterium]